MTGHANTVLQSVKLHARALKATEGLSKIIIIVVVILMMMELNDQPAKKA